MGIWPYGHMAICKKIWPNGVSPKRESKMPLSDVNQRSLGHSNQKLWPKVDFGETWWNSPKSTFGHNFWLECPRDLWLTSLSCIFDSLFGDTPFGHIFLHMPICPYAHMPICPYGQIWAYGHMGAARWLWWSRRLYRVNLPLFLIPKHPRESIFCENLCLCKRIYFCHSFWKTLYNCAPWNKEGLLGLKRQI